MAESNYPAVWKEKFPHLPEFKMPRNYHLTTPLDGVPPGCWTYWSNRAGQAGQVLVLKQFDYDVTGDRQFKFDRGGFAETKALFNSIELNPETAIKTIRVWTSLLEKEGFKLDDVQIK